jgi:hypothetical protein
VNNNTHLLRLGQTDFQRLGFGGALAKVCLELGYLLVQLHQHLR